MLENDSYRGKNIIKESSVILLSNGIKLGGGFITFIIFSRSLSTAELGIFAIVVSFTEIVNELFEFGFDTATVTSGARHISSSNNDKVVAIVRANLLLKLVLSLLLLVAGFVLAGTISEVIFKTSEFESAILLGFCSIPGIMFFDIVISVLRMEQSFLTYALLRGGSALLMLGLIMLFYLNNLLTLPVAIAVYILFIPLITAITGILLRFRKYSTHANGIITSGIELLGFGKWIYLANITEAMRLKLNHFILIKLASATNLGYYYAADRFAEALILLSTTLSTLLLPKASSLTDKNELRTFTIKSIQVVSLISIPALLILPFSEKIISVFFGVQYIPATFPFILLYISLIIEIVCKPLVFALFSLGDSRVVFKQNMITVLFLFTASVYLVPGYSSSGAAFSLLIARLAGNIYILREGYMKVLKTD